MNKLPRMENKIMNPADICTTLRPLTCLNVSKPAFLLYDTRRTSKNCSDINLIKENCYIIDKFNDSKYRFSAEVSYTCTGDPSPVPNLEQYAPLNKENWQQERKVKQSMHGANNYQLLQFKKCLSSWLGKWNTCTKELQAKIRKTIVYLLLIFQCQSQVIEIFLF